MKVRGRYGKGILKNQRGFALISVYLVSVVVLIISTAAFVSVLAESRLLDREITRVQAYATAEAGLQTAMAQIGAPATAYTGFIDTTSIASTPLLSTAGTTVGSFSVDVLYQGQLDWVTLTSTATIPITENTNEVLQLEGRVFLQSNLSKYLMYANTPTLALGTNLILGTSDGINPQGVPVNENERAALYYTNNLDFSGSNINIYGDTHAENFISGDSSNTVHGDTYVGGFTLDSLGRVTNDGINGTLTVDDGFKSDNIDRDGDGRITDTTPGVDYYVDAGDYADRHDLLTASQPVTSLNDDSHKEEVLDQVNLAFYQSKNSEVAKSRSYGTTTAERFFVFEPTADGKQTKVTVYPNQTRYNAANPVYATDSFTLPDGSTSDKPILYTKGSLHVKGEIAGRVAVVSSADIYFDGDLKYAGDNSYCSSANSTAFLARNKVYFRPESLEVSGIIYADKAGSGTLAFDSDYNINGVDNGYTAKHDGHFRHFGNLIADGEGNTSNYYHDRAYIYDPNLKYYRPPGLPIRPELRTVRELSNTEVSN